MKNTKLLGLAKGRRHSGDYTQPSKAMDEVLSACGESIHDIPYLGPLPLTTSLR
jgi:hypothetical protein